ncbi:hypothetical protein MIM_c07800 [Advenella mimigardefordensis DPN7]|uniref:Uncharacterized protein n=1 Tax=Advenella mimigardefordensis (strain DSM 17166 / LMG 22922 / DPN7) TaxID=1247726 RepID=W0P7Q1_ADVMD|nr:hypothetical protein MIM_c07800 [Advenella mimigardefordensis DPN7]
MALRTTVCLRHRRILSSANGTALSARRAAGIRSQFYFASDSVTESSPP